MEKIMGGEKMPFTREYVASLMRYDVETGNFVWLVYRNSFGGCVAPGAVAGTLSDQGYVLVGIDRRRIRAHRLAWFVMTGEWPTKGFEIDHINGNRSDNRWSNLRLVSRSQNNMNANVRRDSTTGVRGVYQRKDTGAWHARINLNGKPILLGQFLDKGSAVDARRSAEAKYFGSHRKA